MKQKMEQIKKANSIIYLDDNEGDDEGDDEERLYATLVADLAPVVRAQNPRHTRRRLV